QGLQVLLADRQAAQETAAAATLEAENKTKEDELVKRIASMLSVNPNGAGRSVQPARIVPNVLQSSAEQNPIQTQIALLQAELTGLKATGSIAQDIMTRRIKLTDEIAALRSQSIAV
ncbi:MAG: hypothetical protein ACEQSX_12205, partial [Baekduiaceae bacterium]